MRWDGPGVVASTTCKLDAEDDVPGARHPGLSGAEGSSGTGPGAKRRDPHLSDPVSWE
jgi:hypothetical protein